MTDPGPDFNAQFFSHADEDDVRFGFADPFEVTFYWQDPTVVFLRFGMGLAAGAALMAISSFALGLGIGYALGERHGRAQQ